MEAKYTATFSVWTSIFIYIFLFIFLFITSVYLLLLLLLLSSPSSLFFVIIVYMFVLSFIYSGLIAFNLAKSYGSTVSLFSI